MDQVPAWHLRAAVDAVLGTVYHLPAPRDRLEGRVTDAVERWLQAERDACTYEFERSRRNTVDGLLASYRERFAGDARILRTAAEVMTRRARRQTFALRVITRVLERAADRIAASDAVASQSRYDPCYRSAMGIMIHGPGCRCD